ncbi:MAG: RDD family protein [Acidimicrobiales bacterium]
MAYPVQTDPTAVFGRRVLAALIDAALMLVPVILLFTADLEYKTAETLQREGITDPCDALIDKDAVCMDLTDVEGFEAVYFSDGPTGTTQAASWLLPIGMHVILQGLTGWTVGKLLTGIRTVREDGRPAGIGKAFLRWLLWIVDGFPYFLPLVGFIVGLTTVGHRRVGDMVAKTFVVRASAAGQPIVVPGLTAPPPPVGSAGAWGAPPPDPSGATTTWGQAVDPGAAGWANPAPPVVPGPAAAPGANAPQWDEARGTYIQWDPVQGAWMQWNEAGKAWSRIPGQ